MAEFNTLATRLRATRKKRGMTQARLASLSGISRANISQIESGTVTRCEATTLLSIATALSVRIEWLIAGSGPRDANGVKSADYDAAALRELLTDVFTTITALDADSIHAANMSASVDLLFDLRLNTKKPIEPAVITRYVQLGLRTPQN